MGPNADVVSLDPKHRSEDVVDYHFGDLAPEARAEFEQHLETCLGCQQAVKTAGILGSSLGGLFSFWAVLQEPPAFMRAAVVSPAFFWGQYTTHQFLQTRRPAPGSARARTAPPRRASNARDESPEGRTRA